MVTGVETAGLILAVLPIVIEALKASQNSYRLLRLFRHRTAILEFDDLIVSLEQQNVLFGNNMGRIVKAAIPRADIFEDYRQAIHDAKIRQKIEDYLTKAHIFQLFERIIADYETSMRLIVAKLGSIEHVSKLRPDEDPLEALKRASVQANGKFEFRKRVSFKLNRNEFITTVKRINAANQTLRDLLYDMDAMHRTQEQNPSKNVQAKALATSLNQLQSFAEALWVALSQSWQHNCHQEHHAGLFLDQRCASTKQVKMIHAHDSEFELLFTTLHGKMLDPNHIWHIFSCKCDPSHDPKRADIDNLCCSLKDVLQANEYWQFHITGDRRLLGLRIPTSSQTSAISGNELLTLESILTRQMEMNFKQRTYLALTVASSLVQFHSTPWINETWTNTDIHFIGKKRDRPLILHSFSTRSNQSDVSPESTLLELGILLLEIWDHKTFEDWSKRTSNKVLAKDNYNDRMISAIQWLKSINDDLPPTYKDAVSVCVRFSFEGVENTWHHPDFRRAVCKKVIMPLQDNCRYWTR